MGQKRMTDDEIASVRSQLTEYDERIERQSALIEAQRQRIETLERILAEGPERGVMVDRRTALKAGGLAGLLALGAGAGTASADPNPSGRIGTENRPIETLYTEALDGGLTENQAVSGLFGPGLRSDGASLAVDAGPGLEIVDGRLALAVQFIHEPDDLDAVLDGMDQDEDGTYVITNVHELQAMNADREADFRLDNDVDAIHTALWNDGDGFDPIGESASRFAGSFDGDGHTVDGLTIDRPGPGTWGTGLFGVTDTGVTIANVVLTNVDVTGGSLVGGLVGETVSGTVEASSVSGAVSGSGAVGGLIGELGADVLDSFATATVTGGARVGGLVGDILGGTVETSFAAGSVSGGDRVGGLVGRNSDGIVETSFAAGSVSGGDHVGGLIGVNEYVVNDSFAIGSVDGDSEVGGLIGRNEDFTLIDVTNSFATGAVIGTSAVGGLVGVDVDDRVSESYWDVPASGWDTSDGGTGIGDLADDPPAEGMVGDDLDPDLESEFDFDDTWETVSEDDPDAEEDDYPILQAIDRAAQLEVRG